MVLSNLCLGMQKKQLDVSYGYPWAYVWTTKKTYLQFSPLPAEYDLGTVDISMSSVVIRSQILNDDF